MTSSMCRLFEAQMDANARFVIYMPLLMPLLPLVNQTHVLVNALFLSFLQFSMPLGSSTLTTLKQKINSDPSLGPISPTQQRLFHLGRELKSSNRSLEALGIGRFNVFTVHLHTGLVTKCLELLDSDDDMTRSNRNRTTNSSNGSNRRKHNNNDNNEVVDLLDDSDDDDDVVEIVEPVTSGGNKRRKKS